MPYHLMLDHAGEAKLGKLEIGTTKRGIGPCYADKAARLGIRVQDMLDEKILKQKIISALEPKKLMLRPFERDPRARPPGDDRAVPDLRPPPRAAHRRHGLAAHRVLDDEQLVIFEGAQAALLDIDHGTYPFVTSSNPVAGAACVGAGVGPRDIDEVWGVAKAYATRVGAGPFPTELDDEIGERIRERGGEFGTTTGRPRRTGWIDLVALRYAARINGMTALVITKLDVLSGFETLKVCTGYRGPEGATLRRPSRTTRPCCTTRAGDYTELPGWTEDISGVPQRGGAARGGARLPALHRGLRRRAGRAGRRRARARQIVWTGERSPLVAAPDDGAGVDITPEK